MTDNEIIKLLECCKKSQCSKCYYSKECDGYTQVNYALDLITRQQAEIDNLKVENQSLRSAANSLKMHYEEAQAKIESLKQRNTVCEAANRCIVWQRDRRDREIEELHSQIAGLNIYKSKIKAEAYKEFAERLKEKFVIADCIVTIDNNDIDNLVKELSEDGENND